MEVAALGRVLLNASASVFSIGIRLSKLEMSVCMRPCSSKLWRLLVLRTMFSRCDVMPNCPIRQLRVQKCRGRSSRFFTTCNSDFFQNEVNLFFFVQRKILSAQRHCLKSSLLPTGLPRVDPTIQQSAGNLGISSLLS